MLGALLLAGAGGWAQEWKASFELRSRLEDRQSVSFGREPDKVADYVRMRFGLTWKPAGWLELHGVAQDARAPGYGPGAPISARNPVDLLEGYVGVRGAAAEGFGLKAGRFAADYGGRRLLGTAQWVNVPRVYDGGRAWWRGVGGSQYELLYLAPVERRPGGFDKPQSQERIWGTYDVLWEVGGGHRPELYLLRHDSPVLGVTTGGSRWTGPLARGWKYSAEAVVQGGHRGQARQRGFAWAGNATREFGAVAVTGEYKYASAEFDVLVPSVHDRLGHMDLFGWRNVEDVQALATWSARRWLALNVMFSSFWAADAMRPLYSTAGAAVTRPGAGQAARHAGEEYDLSGAVKYRQFQFGAGVGAFSAGAYIAATTPGRSPLFFYVFQTYAF